MDIVLVKRNMQGVVEGTIKELTNIPGMSKDQKLEILNAYMRETLKDRVLVGVSLKSTNFSTYEEKLSNDISVSSGLINCTEYGIPSLSKPVGIEIAGIPARLAGIVHKSDIYISKGLLVFSPNLTKSFPNKFLVAKPKIVIKRMKKIAATINKIISVKNGFITSGSLIYLAGVKLTREFNHFPTSKTK